AGALLGGDDIAGQGEELGMAGGVWGEAVIGGHGSLRSSEESMTKCAKSRKDKMCYSAQSLLNGVLSGLKKAPGLAALAGPHVLHFRSPLDFLVEHRRLVVREQMIEGRGSASLQLLHQHFAVGKADDAQLADQV